MTMNELKATLSGFTSWVVRDETGKEVQSGAFHNLITDAGLNAFADEQGSTGVGVNINAVYANIRNYLRVGTGSGAPSATKISLTNQVATQSSNGGFAGEQVASYAVANGLLTGSFPVVRVIDFTSSYNITEYGLSTNASDSLNITELFRDGGGNPVSIPVQNGYQLKLTHTLVVALPFAPAGKVLNLGTGDLNTQQTFFCSNPSYYSDCFSVFGPNNTNNRLRYMTAVDAGSATVAPALTDPISTQAISAYTANSRQRTQTLTVQPANGNTVTNGYAVVYSNNVSGYKVAFQGGATLTKNNTQRLTINVTSSWARA